MRCLLEDEWVAVQSLAVEGTMYFGRVVARTAFWAVIEPFGTRGSAEISVFRLRRAHLSFAGWVAL